MLLYGNDAYMILAYWFGRPLPARLAFARMGEFIVRLRELSRLFDDVFVTAPGYPKLHDDRSNLEAELVKGINPEHGFVNSDPKDFNFALTSFSKRGFWGAFTNAAREADQTASFKITCGQLLPDRYPATPNSVLLAVAPKVETPALLRALFEATIQFWRPADAAVTRGDVMKMLGQPILEAKLGWLTYIADPAAADSVPPDVARELFGDGVIIQAAERPGTAADPKYMAHLFQIRDGLRAEGWLNTRADVSRRA
jgi:hypothetical protein